MGWSLVWAILLGLGQPQLRGPVHFKEEEARAFLNTADSLGYEARIERTYQHGLGWEYSVWIEGFLSVGAAEAAAERLAGATGLGVAVFDGTSALGPPLPEKLAALPASQEVRHRVVRALGGEVGAKKVLEQAQTLQFRFTRSIQEPLIEAKHRYSRAMGREALEVEVVEGSGQGDWRVVSGPTGSWLQQDGELVGLSSRGAKKLLSDSDPAAVYSASLGLAWRFLNDEDFRALEVMGQEVVEHRTAIRLASDSRHGRVEVLVDAQTWLPSSVTYWSGAGRTQRLFVGWRNVESHLVVPEVMETRSAGVLWERIRLDYLSLVPALSEDDFSVKEMP